MSDPNHTRKKTSDNVQINLSPDYAIALGYDPSKNNAPTILAKGQGHVAEKIIQIAIDQGIEIKQDTDLLQILKAVDINEEIPVEAFTAVAEIISYIYQQNAKSLSD